MQVAQNSRRLVEEATRDSNSINAIAAVTMLFLLGTFVAVWLARKSPRMANSLTDICGSLSWLRLCSSGRLLPYRD